MPRYRVSVRTGGEIVVEAESPEQAEGLAEGAPVRLAGCLVGGAETEAETEAVVLEPDDVTQTMSVGG